jgi:hypothetical protein
MAPALKMTPKSVPKMLKLFWWLRSMMLTPTRVMFSPTRDRGAYAIMAGDPNRSVNGRGGLPLRQERKDELTSHDIWRMVMCYRLVHFDCTVAKPQHDLQWHGEQSKGQ